MPYGNPIVAGKTLVRNAIQSVNYVPGVSGWAINRDGTAEFSDLTARGELIAGAPASTGGIVIAPSITAELSAWYLALGYHLVAVSILFYLDDGNYAYMAAARDATLTEDYLLSGVVRDGQVLESFEQWGTVTGTNDYDGQVHIARWANTGTNAAMRVGMFGNNFAGAGSHNVFQICHANVLLGNNGSDDGFLTLCANWELLAQAGSTVQIDQGAAFTIDGNDAPRGIVYWEPITAALTSGAVIGTEYAVWTSAAAITFQPGRAYRLWFINGKIKSGVLQQPAINLRKTSAPVSPPTGTTLTQGPRYPIDDTNADLPFGQDFAWSNSTAAPVSTKVTLTINPTAATLVTFDAGAGAQTVFAVVEDIGSTVRCTGLVSV